MTTEILVVDKIGNPKDWISLDYAAHYYASGKVLWSIGSTVKRVHGGINKTSGEQSYLDISSILGVSGPLLGKEFFTRESVYAEREILYARDHDLCAFCGNVFPHYKLTIDHVHPKSRGGKNTWVNCVTACKPCNHHKGDRTPEEAKMPLLYVPYAPNMFEKMILKGKNVLADQMEYLMARVPEDSRLFAA